LSIPNRVSGGQVLLPIGAHAAKGPGLGQNAK